MKKAICIFSAIFVVCIIVSAVLTVYLDLKNSYEFSELKWNLSPYKRDYIVDDFISNTDVLSMTKSQIIQKLGSKECKILDDYIVYVIRDDGAFLSLKFDEDDNIIDYKIVWNSTKP